MPLNVYGRIAIILPFVILACIYLVFSLRSFRKTMHLIYFGIVTEGHLIVDKKVRFVTNQHMMLEFYSQAAPGKVGTAVSVLYDPFRPSIAYVASATTIGFSSAFNLSFSSLLAVSCCAALFDFFRWELLLIIVPALLVVSAFVGMIYAKILSLKISTKTERMQSVSVQREDGLAENDREEVS